MTKGSSRVATASRCSPVAGQLRGDGVAPRLLVGSEGDTTQDGGPCAIFLCAFERWSVEPSMARCGGSL